MSNKTQFQILDVATPAEYLLGRVIAVHKNRYKLRSLDDQLAPDLSGELSGHFHSQIRCRDDYPVVGDWVNYTQEMGNTVRIHALCPRQSLLKRQASERLSQALAGEAQPIAANVDVACIIMALDIDFNLNRMERYVALCRSASIEPWILLSKSDLVDSMELQQRIIDIQCRFIGINVVAISQANPESLMHLESQFQAQKTYCLLGSSGVGKSSLVNYLLRGEIMKTASLGSMSRGRHTTTHRELFVLPSGALLIDNPGLREVGILENYIPETSIHSHCRFRDCTHTVEPGFWVLQAMATGELDQAPYVSQRKLDKESQHYAMSERERKNKDKAFGKMLKNYQKKNRG